MSQRWVDFRTVKECATFEPLLARYGITTKPEGKELVGLCPFHEDRKPSFHVNPEKKVFHCFGCGAKGNVLDFVARKEAVSIREAALRLAEWQHIAAPREQRSRAQARDEPAPEPPEGEPPSPEETAEGGAPSPAVVLKPLTFSLKLDPSHPYLKSRGLTDETIATFGLGFCNRGLMKGRIAIPIQDQHGQLVAYAGRWPGDEGIPEGEGKYKLPPGFPKSEVLFNLHRVRGTAHLIVVEGYWSVFRLHQLGIGSVALMGSTLSPAQAALIEADCPHRVTLLLDGDATGREATVGILSSLARWLFVRAVALPDGSQPDAIPDADLKQLVAV